MNADIKHLMLSNSTKFKCKCKNLRGQYFDNRLNEEDKYFYNKPT